MHLCRSSSNVPCLPSFLEMLQNPHVLVTFDKVHNPLRLPRETTSELPKVVREWCALYILTIGNVLRATTACNFSSLIWPAGSAPAALASLLFDPPEPQIIGKTQCFATSYLFSHLHLLSSYSFFSNLSLLSASALLCFSFVHIVGSLTSKLPSIISYNAEKLKNG